MVHSNTTETLGTATRAQGGEEQKLYKEAEKLWKGTDLDDTQSNPCWGTRC